LALAGSANLDKLAASAVSCSTTPKSAPCMALRTNCFATYVVLEPFEDFVVWSKQTAPCGAPLCVCLGVCCVVVVCVGRIGRRRVRGAGGAGHGTARRRRADAARTGESRDCDRLLSGEGFGRTMPAPWQLERLCAVVCAKPLKSRRGFHLD
jgi:hypothetical protein